LSASSTQLPRKGNQTLLFPLLLLLLLLQELLLG